MKVKGMRSWNLNTEDLEASVRFYADVLGAEERGRQSVGGADVARLRLGATGIGLFDAAQGPRPGVPHHTLDLDDPTTPASWSRSWRAGASRWSRCGATETGPATPSTSATPAATGWSSPGTRSRGPQARTRRRPPHHGTGSAIQGWTMTQADASRNSSNELFEVVRGQYGERLTPEELEEVRKAVERIAGMAEALRSVPLDYRDEPLIRFTPYRADRE